MRKVKRKTNQIALTAKNDGLGGLAEFVHARLHHVGAFDEPQDVVVGQGDVERVEQLQIFVDLLILEAERRDDRLDLNASLLEPHFFVEDHMIRKELEKKKWKDATGMKFVRIRIK